MATPAWIDIDGAANVRDLGGLPTEDGHRIRAHRLIRSDSLQLLTGPDVRLLVDEIGVRAVADLRTGAEVRGEGPGPMTRESDVSVQHLSLFPEVDDEPGDGPVVLPWQARTEQMTEDERKRGASGIYVRYLNDRPDSVLAALRMIAHTDGATIVHCAAGKDRTGVIVAMALTEVGVPREEIIADYAVTAERIADILGRLALRDTYRNDISATADLARHTPRAETMRDLLAAIDEQFGGVSTWLRDNGWTDDDARALRAQLVE